MIASRMPFAKYRGKLLADVPTDYLCWLTSIDLKPWLREAVRQELSARGHRWHDGGDDDPAEARPHYPPPADLPALITRWHRDLCLRWHPDRGGDVRIMAALNDAVDRLRKLVEVPA